MRLIDADRLLDRCIFYHLPNGRIAVPVIDVQHAPTVEPRPRGKWIDYTDDGYVECPFCGSATNCDDNISELHYCFSCGADMRQREEQE
jgi:hypothetical protein